MTPVNTLAQTQTRLDFDLPDFTRLAWVSNDAREVWAPRLARIADVWSEIAWTSILKGIRECAILHVSPENLVQASAVWAEYRLTVLPLDFSSDTGSHGTMRVAIGKASSVFRLKRYRDAGRHDAVGSLLGYPDCCRDFFYHVWVTQRLTDTTWPMALNSENNSENQQIEVTGTSVCNILHRWIGVRAVHHLPCSFQCPATAALGQQMLSIAREMDCAQEKGWIEEILSWPVEWTALHGIAEVRSPILKLVTQTDATANKLCVRWHSDHYPSEGATGLRFPYRPPSKLGGPAGAKAANHKVEPAEINEWFYKDNGFSTRRSMERSHSSIVAAVCEMLPKGGSIVDLGCGNGALLRRICAQNPSVVPFGLDRNLEAIGHAWILHSNFRDNFSVGDIFECHAFLKREFEIALLMPGRLLEVPRRTAQQLLTLLSSHCAKIVLYVYPGHAAGTIDEICKACGITYRQISDYVGLADDCFAVNDHDFVVSDGVFGVDQGTDAGVQEEGGG